MPVGRHSDGKSNFALSKGAITTLVVVIALIAALTWWLWPSGDTPGQNTAEGECTEGDVTLPVAEEEPGLADALLKEFRATNPVIRDHCVTPEVTSDLSTAAFYISASDPTAALEEAGRSASAESDTIQVPLGLAVAADTPGEGTPAAEQVAYPVASHEDAAVVAATALSPSPADAAALLQRDKELTLEQALADGAPLIAVPADDTPEGYEYRELDVAREYQVTGIATTDGVSEEQVHAADALVRFAAEQNPDTGSMAINREQVLAVREAFTTTPETTEETPEPEEEAMEPVAGTPVDTLFLLDTSAQMNSDFGDRSRFEAGAATIADIAPRLGATGRASSLWNYSSPINPGVTKGYRTNLGFGRGTTVANSVQLLGTAGVPQTRDALAAALQVAGDRARETNAPAKVMLFTSGTADDMSDEQFQSLLDSLPGNVELAAFHLGPGEIDPVLNATPVNSYQELLDLANQSLGL
ncbi:hypothetical protein COCCU_06965 [Corynebacterium occultum]|uniref:VWFA domain-containing protein n=1 Tax=Corynebacterium occultum TaxID=2675219 RepID=A0A6B8W5T1_9CORY|nr:VWA domain-containing protein [Corynebacterium occultum]QGU07327.1 hypothetical protein COCCU_06965 [Corynebacterium occultum]